MFAPSICVRATFVCGVNRSPISVYAAQWRAAARKFWSAFSNFRTADLCALPKMGQRQHIRPPSADYGLAGENCAFVFPEFVKK
jgi:hypothetical protein